jgi:hypothetical protein
MAADVDATSQFRKSKALSFHPNDQWYFCRATCEPAPARAPAGWLALAGGAQAGPFPSVLIECCPVHEDGAEARQPGTGT